VPIPVIDLFAGPGGLGEGFAACTVDGAPQFKIALSIEKDPIAHQTLELRASFPPSPPHSMMNSVIGRPWGRGPG
jgi:DNA (cytosine-5)-methyltransferase 1